MTWFHDRARGCCKARRVITVRDDHQDDLSFDAAVGCRPTGRARSREIVYAQNL